MSYKILSIDAWAGSCGDCERCKGNEAGLGCWEWNEWFTIGELKESHMENVMQSLIDEGFLTDKAWELCEVEDDGHNIVITQKATAMPLYAVEYGVHS